MRTLAWTAIGAQAAFVTGWIAAGAAQPGYEWTRQRVSELAADGAAHPWIVALSLLVWAGGFAALALALPGAPARALFTACAVLAAALAFLPLDCAGCGPGRSWHHTAHLAVSGVLELVLTATPFALRRYAWGIAGIGVWVIVALGTDGGERGLWQRVGLLAVCAWVVVVAAGLLTSAHDATPSPRSPRRARPHPAAPR